MGLFPKTLYRFACAASVFACSGIEQGPKPLDVSLTALVASQTMTVGTKLVLVARVYVDGKPGVDIPVSWSATGGDLWPVSITNAEGLATVDWTMPTTPTTVAATGRVSYQGINRSVTFSSSVVVGDPAFIEKQGGDSATTSVNSCYRLFYARVRVSDKFGNEIPKPRVEWTVLDGPVEAGPYSSSAEAAFQAGRTVGPAHVRGTVNVMLSADFMFSVTPARYDITHWDDDRGGDPYFESGQNCGGYPEAAPIDTVPVGHSVTWTNYSEAVLHLIAADSTVFSEIAAIPTNGTHTVVFATPGRYRYADVRRPAVIGTIIVQ